MRKPVRKRRQLAPPPDSDGQAAQTSGGSPVDLGRLWLAVVRDWRWFPIAMLIGALVGVAVAKFVVKRSYTASTVLLWEPTLSENASRSERDLSTRLQSVKLPANLLEVRRRLGLGVPLKALELRTSVRPEPQSNLVTISASDSEPEPAAALADTLVEVFLEHGARLAQARLEERTQKLEADLDDARTTLANARATYDAFRTEHGIADLAAETQIAIQHVAQLRSSADVARADAEALQARASRLEAEARRESAHQVQGSTQSSPVLAQLARLRAELAAANTRLAPEHPTIVALEAQIEALAVEASGRDAVTTTSVTLGLNAQLASLKTTIAQSSADREAAVQRQEVYRKFAAEAEQRLQQLSAVEGQASVLLGNIQLHEERVSRLEGELVVVGDAARSTRPEFRALTPALVPEEAESARKKVAMVAPFLAALLALLVVIGKELRGFKVVTATEAAFWAKGPVVASSVWPRDTEMLSLLVDELADHAPFSTGTTLVLGASDAEAPLAREMAYWLSTMRGPEQKALGAGVSGHDATAASTAIAVVSPDAGASRVAAHTWEGETDGQAMRRAARLASRVLVVLQSNTMSMPQLAQTHARLGRDAGVAILLVGLDPAFVHLRDRVGSVSAFWRSEHVEAEA